MLGWEEEEESPRRSSEGLKDSVRVTERTRGLFQVDCVEGPGWKFRFEERIIAVKLPWHRYQDWSGDRL